MPDYRPNTQNNALDAFLKGMTNGADIGGRAANQRLELNARQQMQQQSEAAELDKLIKGKREDQSIETENYGRVKQDVEDARKLGRKVNSKMGSTSYGEAETVPNPMADVRKQALLEKGMSKLSERYEKLNGFNSALNEVEGKTNYDGNGGVITNPNAKLKSTGKAMSAIPTSLIGIGEMINPDMKGASDERKTLERLKLEYQKAMSGMRVTDQARKQENQAMGWMASGDPDLVSKGVRALAHNVKNAVSTVQAGYTPEVQEHVHSQMGNPLDAYANLVDDSAQAMKARAAPPKQPAMQQAPAQQAPAAASSPQASSDDAEMQEYLALKAKHKPGQ